MAEIKDSYTNINSPLTAGLSLDATTDIDGETYTASLSYSITRIDLYLNKQGSPTSSAILYAGVRAVNSSTNKPIGSNLITSTGVTADTIVDDSWNTFTFSTPLNVENGTKYCIVLYCTGSGFSGSNCVTWWTKEVVDSTKTWVFSTNGGTSWSTDTTYDHQFKVWGTSPSLTDKKYSRKLVAIGNNEVWYESSAGTMTELAAANGQINVGNSLSAVEAYQKIFIVNETTKKVFDFINTKISTTDAGANPCTRSMTLTGGTSVASMIVDYVDGVTDNAVMNVYGYRTTTVTFSSGETVTGTNSAGNAVSFVLSAAETAPPHWYNWTVFGNDTTNYGTMPSSSFLIALYRGRVVTNDDTKPYAWTMFKVGDPFKCKYDTTNDGDLSAVTHTNTKVGEIGDIITAIIPYKDDLLIWGCANSLWILIGDPLSEGQLAQITNKTGIWGSRAWCIDDSNNLYFLGSDGVYRMPVTETISTPENISKLQLPNLIKDWDLDKSLHRIVVSFDPINKGILVTKVLISDGTCEGYWYDLTTQGWFPESYPASCGIFSSHFYTATDETYRKFLLGCNDGYIREFDIVTKNDATTTSTQAINSYCTILKQLSEDDSKEGLLQSLGIVLAGGAASGDFSDTDSLSYALYKGNDAETCLEDIIDVATAFTSGTWTTPGEQNRIRPRMRGTWMGLKLYDNTASKTWAIEKLYADIYTKGEK